MIVDTPDGKREFPDDMSMDDIKGVLRKKYPAPEGWGIKGWQGDITMPQSVRDWGNRAANEALAYSIPSLRAEAEAAKKRMDPASAASADLTGSVLSQRIYSMRFPMLVLALLAGVTKGLRVTCKATIRRRSWRTRLLAQARGMLAQAWPSSPLRSCLLRSSRLSRLVVL